MGGWEGRTVESESSPGHSVHAPCLRRWVGGWVGEKEVGGWVGG